MEIKIQELRKANKVSQTKLAEALAVTGQTVISLEERCYNASLELAYKVAGYFGKVIEEIFIFEDEKQEKKINILYEIIENNNHMISRNVGLVMLNLGQLLSLTALVINLNDLSSGFLLTMSIMLNVLSIAFFQDKILRE